MSEQSSSNGGARGGADKSNRKRKRKNSLLSVSSADPLVNSTSSAESRRRHVSLGDAEPVKPMENEREFGDGGSSAGSLSPPSASRRLAIARHQRLTRYGVALL